MRRFFAEDDAEVLCGLASEGKVSTREKSSCFSRHFSKLIVFVKTTMMRAVITTRVVDQKISCDVFALSEVVDFVLSSPMPGVKIIES